MSQIVGVILAGGLARRMGGGDKCLIELAGRPLLARTIERFAPQVPSLILNANGDPSRFASFQLPVVADSVGDYAGPLAGILAAMEWVAAHKPDVRWIAGIAGDVPFLPRDFVSKLRHAQVAKDAELVCASSNGQIHPVCGLWSIDLADDLRHFLRDENLRKVGAWTGRHRMEIVDFSIDPIDPFFNINTPADLATAEALLASHSGRPV